MDPYVGEIRLFAGSYAPRGWAFCEGQTLDVLSNQLLFAVIGNTFGGDGKTTFSLPDLRGAAVMHQGAGPGLTPRVYAKGGGQSEVGLAYDQMPAHDHEINAQTKAAEQMPFSTIWASGPGGKVPKRTYSQLADTPMNPNIVGAVGGGQPHNNIQPYLSMNYMIALEGVFPPKA